MLEAPHTLALSRYLDSIAACTDCATACDFCAAACLREPDPRHMAKCIALDMDCAGHLPVGGVVHGKGQRACGPCVRVVRAHVRELRA